MAGSATSQSASTEAGGGSRRRLPPCGGEFRAGFDDPRGDRGESQAALAARIAVQQPLETEFPHGAGHRCHMSMRQRTAQGHGVVDVRENGAALRQKADALDEVGLKFGEIAEGAPIDASVFPPGLPDERRGDASVVGNVFDVG